MSYYNYQFRTHSMQRVSKKVLGHKQSLLEVWRMVGETSTDADKHIELWLAQEEFAALTYGVPNYYFINDLKTAEGIERATFHAKSITLQNQIKFLSWPKGFKIDDVIAKGCMVAVLDSVERSHIHDDFTRRMKLPRTKYAVDRDETAGYISINYESPYSIGMHCRLSIPFDLLTPIVEAETHEDMLDILSNKLFGSGMNDTELRYQLALTKLCIKTLVYVQACPDKVVEAYRINVLQVNSAFMGILLAVSKPTRKHLTARI